MKLDQAAIRKLEQILNSELSQYETYLSLLEQEQHSVVVLKAESVSSLSDKRSKVVDRITQLRDQRNALVAELSGQEAMRLSEFIEVACEPLDRKRLRDLVKQIKEKLALVERKSSEFSQILNFSLGLVNGEISILWSASQSVNRVYNSFGTLTEASQPAAPRVGSLLGEA